MIIIKKSPVIKQVVEQNIIVDFYSKKNTSSNLFTSFLNNIYKNEKEKIKTDKLNQRDFSFGVLIDTDQAWKFAEVVTEAAALGLTFSGDQTNIRKKHMKSVFNTELSDILIFGKNDRFDVTREEFVEGLFTTVPIYSLSDELQTVLKAVRQFSAVKKSLIKKYPRNTFSPTLYELVSLNKTTKKEKKEKQQEEVVITSDWIRVGKKYIDKNSADDVVYRTRKTDYIIPGIYYYV